MLNRNEIFGLVRRGYDSTSWEGNIRNVLCGASYIKEYAFHIPHDKDGDFYYGVGRSFGDFQIYVLNGNNVDDLIFDGGNIKPYQEMLDLINGKELILNIGNKILIDREPLQVFSDKDTEDLIIYKRFGYIDQ